MTQDSPQSCEILLLGFSPESQKSDYMEATNVIRIVGRDTKRRFTPELAWYMRFSGTQPDNKGTLRAYDVKYQLTDRQGGGFYLTEMCVSLTREEYIQLCLFEKNDKSLPESPLLSIPTSLSGDGFVHGLTTQAMKDAVHHTRAICTQGFTALSEYELGARAKTFGFSTEILSAGDAVLQLSPKPHQDFLGSSGKLAAWSIFFPVKL